MLINKQKFILYIHYYLSTIQYLAYLHPRLLKIQQAAVLARQTGSTSNRRPHSTGHDQSSTSGKSITVVNNARKQLKPMTREQWLEHSTRVRRELDPYTGRMRYSVQPTAKYYY